MKPREKKPETVYRIIDKKTGNAKGSYSRACCDEYDFNSISEARSANVHGVFEDENKYRIAKYKVTYELIEDDADNVGVEYEKTQEELVQNYPPKVEFLEQYPLLIKINGEWHVKRNYDKHGNQKSGNLALTGSEVSQLMSAQFHDAIAKSIVGATA